MGLMSAPFRGLRWIFEEVANHVEDELYNEEAVKAELTDCYLKLEAGALTEEEFAEREAELVTRLEEIAEHNQRRSDHGDR
jgi:Gas vesicle protein G